MTDYKTVVPKAQSGDPKALDELYKSTSRAVYFTCLSLLKNPQDAEDLMQNTFVTAFKKLKTLEQPEKFEPWIKRVAVNLCKDHLAQKGAHPTQPLDEEDLTETDENFLPDEYVTAAEKRSIVMQIMRENLSDVLYQTVIMFYFDEMSVATIAQEMNCPEGTVKYRLNAARAKIKQGVLDYEKKHDDKLYAFVGLPFLARLLIEESKAVNVPMIDMSALLLNNSPYIPDNAVDPNLTANTAKHIGGKMLGTLKAKLIAGAVAAAVVGGGAAAVAAIVNNSDHSADSSYTSRTGQSSGSSNISNSGNSGTGNTSDTVDFSKSRFWIARQSWTEAPRTDFEGGILRDNRKTIDLHEIDELSAPFLSVGLLEKENDYLTSTFEDCLNSQKLIEPGEHLRVTTQYKESGTIAPPYDGLNEIVVFNFDTEPRTAAYCFGQNWWKNYIGTVYPDETYALGLDHSLRQTGISPDESALLDAVKAKFGTPHYIRFSGSMYKDLIGDDARDTFYKIAAREFDPEYEDSSTAIYYDMIYDYGDLVMLITVHEQLFSKKSSKTDLCYVEFWRKECWEHRRDIEPFYGGERESELTFTPSDGKPAPSGNGQENSPAPAQNNSPFWFAKQTWDEAPRKEFEGGWLLDNRKTIDPEQLDDICAPYYNPLMKTAGNIAGSFAAALLAENDISDYDYVDITAQYVGYGEPLPEFSGVELIRVFNFDNIPHSLYDCYENGWWKLAAGENYGSLPETTALGLDASLRDPNTTPNESALLDAIIKKFGTPHFVRYVGRDPDTDPNADRKQALLDDMATAADPSTTKPMAMSYALVYDYGDIIMTVSVWEQRHSSGSFSTSVDYVEFWSPECWENRADVIDMDSDWDEFSLFTVYEP